MNWNEWKKINKNKISHVVNFEEKFVDRVLMHIPMIKPENVIAQYHFIDHKGKNRYIDFVIELNEGNIFLAIELDGICKFNNYASINDLLERQNDIIINFEHLFRYTNKKMLNDPQSIIDQISDFLYRKQNNQSTIEIERQNKEQNDKEIKQVILEVQKEISNLKSSKTNKKNIIISTIISLILFVLIFQSGILTKINTQINFIKPNETRQFVNKTKNVCGLINQIYPFGKGIFLNFGDKYPNQTFSALIWQENIYKFNISKIEKYDNDICIEGVIEIFNDKPRIILNDPSKLIFN